MNKYIKILSIVALISTLPMAINAKNIKPVELKEEMTFHTKTTSKEIDRETSTLVMNDGNGKLTQFDMEREGENVTLHIQQDGETIYKKTYKIKDAQMDVSKEIKDKKTIYMVMVGSNVIILEINENETWSITETQAVFVNEKENLKFKEMEIK